jgi:superfamily II DNA or RNA helicase
MNTELRAHQVETLDKLHAALAEGHRRVVVQAPTGAGKTLMAVALIQDARARGEQVIFCVPAISLVDQTVQALRREGIDQIGVMQAQHEMTDWDQPVQVCSIQTLSRRKKPKAGLVILDECHVWFQHYGEWMLDPEWTGVPFIGLSATPWTRGLGQYYTKLIVASTTQQLIDEGLLSDFKVFAPYRPDLSQVRTVAGDWHEGDLAKLMNTNTLVADTVQTWLRKGESRPTLCFGVDRAHAKALQEDFVRNGVACDYQDCNTKDADRLAIKGRFHGGQTKVVCNVGTLTTGIDWDVRCIVLARPTKSEMLFVQIIGRGLRTANGKDHCLILDHSDTHFRLGFVTDVAGRHDKLDDGAEKRPKGEADIPLPKVCKGCGALIPPRSMECPHCGFRAAPLNGRLVFADGELVELDRKLQEQKARIQVIDALRMLGKQATYCQLLHIARSRGYKDGWAANKYRAIWDVWPVGVSREPEAPCGLVQTWVREEAKAWVRSQPPRNAQGNGFERPAVPRPAWTQERQPVASPGPAKTKPDDYLPVRDDYSDYR